MFLTLHTDQTKHLTNVTFLRARNGTLFPLSRQGSRTITKIPGGKKLQLCYKSNLFATCPITVTYNNTP